VTSATSADRLIWPSIGCGACRFPPILRPVIGEEFASVLARAQRGDEAAFARLWLDVNPALVRYLRVVSGEVDEDVAAEAWVTVVRGLARFRGDETAWRGWVFTTARRRAVDEGRRRARRRAVLASESAGPSEPVGRTAPDAGPGSSGESGHRGGVGSGDQARPVAGRGHCLACHRWSGRESVARIVGRRPGAVRVAAHRGLRRLAQIMANEGVTL
jgi:RNA polymerase sigma-70 factor, ECF subfamily